MLAGACLAETIPTIPWRAHTIFSSTPYPLHALDWGVLRCVPGSASQIHDKYNNAGGVTGHRSRGTAALQPCCEGLGARRKLKRAMRCRFAGSDNGRSRALERCPERVRS
jgi:hypothetical protein